MTKTCVVVGVGPGNGSAIAERFDAAGYQVALLARSEDFTQKLAKSFKNAKAYVCDVEEIENIRQTFARIAEEFGKIDTVVYNAGSGHWGTIEEIDVSQFESNWRVNVRGLFLVSQIVLPSMKKRQDGQIIIIGATASKRGKATTTAFASAKAAQRSLAESMARYCWPHGVHVAIVTIDGIVDLPKTRAQMQDKPDDFFVKPQDVAATVYGLTQQPKSTWVFEVEVRPYGENW